MPLHRALRLPCLLACWLFAAGAPAVWAATDPRPAERGFPLIQTYVPTLPEANSQSFGITRDPQGVIYVANLSGVLTYDGAWWRLIPIGAAQTAFSIAAAADGRILVGGVDDLGYLAPDPHGSLRFVSLLPLLPAAERTLQQVLQVVATHQGAIYSTTRQILLWDGRRLLTVAREPGDRPYAMVFEVGATTYVWQRDGLFRLTERRLVPVPAGEQFRGRRIDQMLPASDGVLVSVRGEGLFLFREGEAARPFSPAGSRWAKASRVLPDAGARLADGRWALGSVLGGLLLLSPDGSVDQVFDSSVGLPDDFVNDLVVDREGALWLALNNGLARVQAASPLSVIDRRSGVIGSVYRAVRHRGALWVATAAGLFTAAPRPADAASGPPRFAAVPGIPPSAWSLASIGDDLLVGTAFGVYQIRGDGPAELIPGSPQTTAYALAPSRVTPDRVWVGFESGLGAIRRAAGGRRFEGSVLDTGHTTHTVVEGNGGTVWCGNSATDVVGVDFPAGAADLSRPRLRRIPGSGDGHVYRLRDGVVVFLNHRLLRLDEGAARLVADPGLAFLTGRDANRLAEDADGNVWFNSTPPAVALRQGSGWARELRVLFEVPARQVEAILAEPDGVVWLLAESGLYRYTGLAEVQGAPLAAPRLSRVTAGGKETLFGGASGAVPAPAELAFDVRHLRLELAPLSFRAGLRYQTRLEPLDADWSSPSPEPVSELTRLPAGDYTVHLRTAGSNRGEVSPETTWSFRVRPPWYQTVWAWAGALLLALLGVRGYARLRGRALHQRAVRLETRISEQTDELRHTVAELRHAQKELEAANQQLEELSQKDELTGIANRRRLQGWLEEEWGRAGRHGPPIAFILLDLDHFKRLNDTRGHPEGDQCLQAVAQFLSRSVRRPGDLVARYGGEEFAVLLSGTPLTAALEIAELLRAGIEWLALPHEAAPTGRVTASFGVAAMKPKPHQRPEMLIEAADLALYRAKTEGRNRVRAGGIAGESGAHEAVAH